MTCVCSQLLTINIKTTLHIIHNTFKKFLLRAEFKLQGLAKPSRHKGTSQIVLVQHYILKIVTALPDSTARGESVFES